MDQVSHLSPSVFLCFPCISMSSSQLPPLQSGWRRQSPWCLRCLAGQGGCPFCGMIVRNQGAIRGLWKAMRKKVHLAHDIKWTWLWLLTFVLVIFLLPVGRSGPFQESQPFVPSHAPPPHFPTDLLL